MQIGNKKLFRIQYIQTISNTLGCRKSIGGGEHVMHGNNDWMATC